MKTHTNMAVVPICSLMLSNSVLIMSGIDPRVVMDDGTDKEVAPVAAAAATAAAITDVFFLAGEATKLHSTGTISYSLKLQLSSRNDFVTWLGVCVLQSHHDMIVFAID